MTTAASARTGTLTRVLTPPALGVIVGGSGTLGGSSGSGRAGEIKLRGREKGEPFGEFCRS